MIPENGLPEQPQSCGPECSCNKKKGLSANTKMILFIIIIVCAGAVLANSIIRRAHQTKEPAKSDYASALADNQSPIIKKDSLSEITAKEPGESFIPLPSLSALDQLAAAYDGVFILLIKNETEKTQSMTKEIKDAINAIAGQGLRMGAFQLAGETPEFAMLNAQLPSPGVVVIIKGKGMRGVSGNDITQNKLLQACFAAMLPSGCGPGACKTPCK
jgi:flagellar basal body-associated protein FliL